MTLAHALHEQYLQRFPADAARALEDNPDVLGNLEHLSRQSLVQLFEHVDPAFLKTFFMVLKPAQQQELLQGASIRTSLQILVVIA